MDNTNPQYDQITTNVGDNAHNVAIGKEITQTNTTVTSSGDRSVAVGGDLRNNVVVTGDYNQVYVAGRKIGPPLHYPPRAEHFVGRKDELEKLLADLHPGRVVTLCGPGGIGKSALAAEALAQLAADATQPPARFPDGVFFHSFYNQKEAALALEQIARSFGEDPRPTPALAAQRALAGKCSLLILDGAEDADDLPAVLAVRGHCGVLVTSRKRSDAVAERQDVKPLPTDEAVNLLQQLAGARALDAQATAARSICALVGDLPLAVRLVGRYLAVTDLTATEYLIWLQQTPLQALDQGGCRDQSVNVLLERSVQRLSPLAQEALGVVGALALTPFPADWVALALAQATGPAPSRPLGELVNYGLLLRQDDGQYTVSHALIHTYAAQITPAAVVERLAAHFNQFARQQRELGPPGFAALDVVLPHLLRVLDHCVPCSLWASANRLVWAIATHDGYLKRHGRWLERTQVLQIGIQAAHALDARYDEGAHFGHLGLTYSDLEQMDKAIENHQQALAIAKKIDNLGSEGACLGNLGLAYRHLGQMDKAIENHQQALVIAKKIDDRHIEGNQLGNLGIAYALLGQLDKAIEYCQQALTIHHEIGYRDGEGHQLGNLGNMYSDLGQMEQAVVYYQRALTIAQEIGDRPNEGASLVNLAGAYRQLGQLDAALTHAEQGLQIAREIHNPHSEAYGLWALGTIYHDKGDVSQARIYLQQALALFEQVKSPAAAEVRSQLAEWEK